MKTAEANAIVSAVTGWAIERGDICAMALVGSWARGNPRQDSDIDLLLLSDRAHESTAHGMAAWCYLWRTAHG